MRTTRIDIESSRGRATILRSGSDIVVNVTQYTTLGDAIRQDIGHDASWLASANNPDQQQCMAVSLQILLDGHVGAAGDVADYQRVIEIFAD